LNQNRKLKIMMAKLRNLLPVLLGAAAMTAVPAQAGDRRSPEQQLEQALRGRVAGEPVDCINLRSVRNSRVINRTAILFDAGGTIYVNRPRSGAQSLTDWDTQVVRPFGQRLCTIDTITMVDPGSGFFRGTVFLGEFVPYHRVRRD
jgi:hypothetical protein